MNHSQESPARPCLNVQFYEENLGEKKTPPGGECPVPGIAQEGTHFLANTGLVLVTAHGLSSLKNPGEVSSSCQRMPPSLTAQFGMRAWKNSSYCEFM